MVVELFGVRFRVDRVTCLAEVERGAPFLNLLTRAVDESASKVGIVYRRGLLSAMGSPQWKEDTRLDYAAVAAAWEWNDAVIEESRRFVLEHFGHAPFLAVHWRRGDRGHAEVGQWGQYYWRISGVSNVIERIRSIMNQSSVSRVFIATNSGSPTELAELLAATSGVTYHSLSGIGNELHRVAVEMNICSLSTAFLAAGNTFWMASSISRTIIETRQRRGLSEASSFFLF
jgi:hypothetical protein